MTAQELQAVAADAAKQAAEYRALTEQHTHTGAVFDYAAPLPPAPNYRPREWETRQAADVGANCITPDATETPAQQATAGPGDNHVPAPQHT